MRQSYDPRCTRYEAGVTRLGSHLLVSAGHDEVVAVCLHGRDDLLTVESHSLLMKERVDWFTIPDGYIHTQRQFAEPPDTLDLETLQTWAIRQALQLTGGNREQAAPLLGLKSSTLRNRLADNPHIEGLPDEERPALRMVK